MCGGLGYAVEEGDGTARGLAFRVLLGRRVGVVMGGVVL